jgi:hypothetical protein
MNGKKALRQCGLVQIAIALTIIFVAGCSHGGAEASSASAAPSSPVPSSAQARSEGLVLGDWLRTGGQAMLTKMTEDRAAVPTSLPAAKGGQALEDACTNLYLDATVYQEKAAIPVARMQTEWAAELTNYAMGAFDCILSIRSPDKTAAGRGTIELNYGDDHRATLQMTVNEADS